MEALFEDFYKEKSRQDTIFEAIKAERTRQDGKWGKQNHPPITWVAILGEEFGEVGREALEHRAGSPGAFERYKTELVQLAAVAVAMLECADRNTD